MSKEKTRVFTVMTFNVAHGRGTHFHQTLVRREDMEQNLRDIARHILLHKPHIVALQELDQSSFWNHHVDQLSYLRELTRYAHAQHGIHAQDIFFFRRLMVRYGVGILSRLEPLDFVSQPFGLGRLDTKGFTSKKFQFNDQRLMVIALHLDFQRNQRRLQQLEQVIAHVKETRGPDDCLIIMGDFNCTLDRSNSPLHMLMDQLDLKAYAPEGGEEHITYPAFRRRLDYILVDKRLYFQDYRTGAARLSDHEYVVAKLRV